jgi:ribosome maturation protein SDO1
MIPIDKAVIARYTLGAKCFEVLVDPEKSLALKHGEAVSLEDSIAAREVFSDSKKGERASETDVNKVFGTNDFEKVLIKIIKDGEIQITTEQKRKMQENRRKQIIAIIAKGAVDPRTHLPHPITRLEKAVEEMRVNIDPFKPASSQVDDVLKKLRSILPIKIETVKIVVRIPPEHAPRSCCFLKGFSILKEEWQSNGSLIVVVELQAGMQSDFFDGLNKLTQGNVETKIIERV